MTEHAIHAASLFAAIIVVAGLVNRFQPAHRVQVRRSVILFLLYVVAYGIHYALLGSGVAIWAAPGFLVAAQLLEGFTLVNLGATAVFSVMFPATGIGLPMIASDLTVGLGYIAVTFGVLSIHDVNLTGAIASAAVVSAALVISLQSTLGNILGGVALQLDGSIHEGDWIQLENGKQGRIRGIRWRHTVVETRDWSTIIVPNAQLLASSITILGKRDGCPVPQRMWVWFNIDFRFPPTQVIQTVEAALAGAIIAGVASDPKPNCVCMDFTKDGRESVASYAVRYWLTDLAADDPTSSRVRARVFTALRRAGIPFALPSHIARVHMNDESHAKKSAAELHAERFAALRSTPVFHPLTDEELNTLAGGLSHVIYVAGETITRQGAVAHWLYILTRGEVDVRLAVDPDASGPLPPVTKILNHLVAPEVFGEMGMMTGSARVADVIATTDVDCFRLDKVSFERIIRDRPEIAHGLSEKLAERRVQLLAVRDGLDDAAQKACQESERDRILAGIRTFFGL